MVDLHESLRPTATAPPLPINEIAARVKRRKRRRLISTTGLATASLGIAAFAISALPGSPETATIADGIESTTASTTSISQTSPSSSTPPTSVTDETEPPPVESETTETTAATPTTAPTDSTGSTASTQATRSADTVSTEPDPVTTPGLRTSTTTTSQWDDGYCIQIEVANDTGHQSSWQVVLDRDGTVAEIWNAAVDESSSEHLIFSGLDGYNTTLRANATTSFGTCINTGGN